MALCQAQRPDHRGNVMTAVWPDVWWKPPPGRGTVVWWPQSCIWWAPWRMIPTGSQEERQKEDRSTHSYSCDGLGWSWNKDWTVKVRLLSVYVPGDLLHFWDLIEIIWLVCVCDIVVKKCRIEVDNCGNSSSRTDKIEFSSKLRNSNTITIAGVYIVCAK